ncbi:MAG: ABC transporter ATP-binding protein [Acidimicrobiales bacterium]
MSQPSASPITLGDADPATTNAVPVLRFENVVAGYGGGDVLHGVSFGVADGGMTCVVGPNGAGKSTLLSTVCGILRPRLGDVMYRGESLRRCSTRERLRRGIVLVPQNHSLFRDMTVRENVELGAFLERDHALVRRRFDEIVELFPVVAERAKEKAGSLSGGQQRLVEFARGLMLDPSLIVLDEPSMGLDPKTLRIVLDKIATMHAQGRTILLVEQNARAGLTIATHGVVLENGKVLFEGSGEEVLENPEIGALFLGGATSADRDLIDEPASDFAASVPTSEGIEIARREVTDD